jgi:hypothetical protein
VDYLLFTIGFTAIHVVVYTIAGIIVLRVPGVGQMYGGGGALFGAFMRDSEDPAEARRLGRLLIPSQVLRGVLMSLVLFPVLGAVGDIHLGLRFLFFTGLFFVYADFGSAIPFANTIEGLVYLKERFVRPEVFFKIQVEAVTYSIVAGFLIAWLLF